MARTPSPARERHDLMTWVTVQSHDIGDTFSGIYALERVFGVGGADAICACDQKQERGVCVCVCAVWDQSQERLQVVAALSGRRSKGVGRSFASTASSREKAAFGVAGAVGQSAPSASELGSEKVAAAVAKGFSWKAAYPGGEHVGALACGVGFGEEAPAKGAARTALDGEGRTRAQRLQRSVDNRLQRLVSHRRWKAMRTADGARFVQSLCIGGGALAQSKRCGGAPGDGANFSPLWPAQNHSGGQWRTLWRQRRCGSRA